MSYRVVWQPTAEQQLARIWTNAADRPQVTAAAHQIDRLLAAAPRVRSQWLSGTTRVLYIHPLAVALEIVEDDQLVRVLAVWEYR